MCESRMMMSGGDKWDPNVSVVLLETATDRECEKLVGIAVHEMAIRGSELSERGWALLSEHDEMKILEIRGIEKLTLSSSRSLSRLSGVYEYHTLACDASVCLAASGMKTLKRFTASGCSLDDSDLEMLKGKNMLTNVDVYDNRIYGSFLEGLTTAKSLSSISIGKNPLTSQAFTLFSQFRSLQRLILTNCDIDHDWWSLVGQHPKLRTLMINGTGIRSQGLRTIRKNIAIEELWLSPTDIGEAELLELCEMQKLKRLFIVGEDEAKEAASSVRKMFRMKGKKCKVSP